ncbi:MAG: hypothetical protein IAF00_04855 [Phycisphaerales bacterium]|nr:hypothetical protein [Phycisphaerales bacterium]
MRLRALLLLATILTLVLTGCRSNPIYNINNEPIATSTHRYSLQDVRGAILRAGTGLGWRMKSLQPGLIIGTLYLRDHMAEVEIPYDRDSYSIKYRDSNNLDYDGANIHRNYNGWVQRLQGAINAQLSSL